MKLFTKKEKKEEASAVGNDAVLGIIAPTVLQFGQNALTLGDTEAAVYAVTRYPAKVEYGWLSDVANQPGTVTEILYTPETDVEAIIKDISRTVRDNTVIADSFSGADVGERVRAEKLARDGTNIIEQIANEGESVGVMDMLVMAMGRDQEDLEKRGISLGNRFLGRRFQLQKLAFLQQQAFAMISPCSRPEPLICAMTRQLIPLSSLMGGFPFAFAGYNDGAGQYVGKDSAGGIIVVDFWRRGGDRNNSNLVCMGLSGAGKSTAIKHLLLNEYELGTKMIIIDPQGEYKDLCANLDGDWIDVAGGSGGHINPFHIYPEPKDADETLSPLAQHINNLEVFFRLYLDLTTIQVAVLKECIEAAYAQKGITFDSDIRRIPADGFPRMPDVYAVIQEKSKEADKTLRDGEPNPYKELSYLLRSAAVGADKHIWDHPSSVNPTKNFVVFDTQTVRSAAGNLSKALYHVILGYADMLLTENPNERVILVCDEAHYIIDKRVPESLSRLAKIAKTCRKREGGLWICSQQLTDYLSPEIEKDGRALLEQANLKLLISVAQDLKSSEGRQRILIAVLIPFVFIFLIINIVTNLFDLSEDEMIDYGFTEEEILLVEDAKLDSGYANFLTFYLDQFFDGDAAGQHGRYPLPCTTEVIRSGFGYRTGTYSGFHSGLDFATDHHSPVFAIAPGKVVIASFGVRNSYGNYIKIRQETDEDGEFYTLYAHLSGVFVNIGDTVTPGQIIGQEGGQPGIDPNPSDSTGHHLHFEIRLGSSLQSAVDPEPWLFGEGM